MLTELRRGDVFVTYNPWWIGRLIIGMQNFWAKDKKSDYSHAGIIISDSGKTFEALATYKSQHISKDYKGIPIAIFRPIGVERSYIGKAITELKEEYDGKPYPGWRLIYHVIPPLAARLHAINRPVCSELVAKYLNMIGIRDEDWWGVNPDNLYDEWVHYRDYELVYEGKVNGLPKIGIGE